MKPIGIGWLVGWLVGCLVGWLVLIVFVLLSIALLGMFFEVGSF